MASEPADLTPGVTASEAAAAHYFDADPAVESDPVVVDVVLPDVAFTLETDRGVFSRGRLDVGTSLLLRHPLPLAATGDLLDLGCGSGPIALAMAKRAPAATVWAIDVNERARELCARNAERNSTTNVRVCHPDDVPDDIAFTTIWSNPPIRIGKSALHALLTRWLGHLTDDGTVALVVQKHLGADSLQRWLGGQGLEVERAASKRGFRLLTAERRGAPASDQ